MEMIYQKVGIRRTYIEEEFISGIQVVTVYVLWPSNSEAEYLLKSEDRTNNSYSVVKDVYRFYSNEDGIVRKDSYEIYYEPKQNKNDFYHVKSIKMFSNLDPGYRTDWYCKYQDKITYRTYEIGSEKDIHYQKFVYDENLNKFNNNGNFYEGFLSNVELGNELLEKVDIVNADYEERMTLEDSYYNQKVKLKTLAY